MVEGNVRGMANHVGDTGSKVGLYDISKKWDAVNASDARIPCRHVRITGRHLCDHCDQCDGECAQNQDHCHIN